jgi:hypothetical protein
MMISPLFATVNEAEQAEVRTREGQYRPVMFDCTVKQQHGVRTVQAGEDKKNLNKWPKRHHKP